MYEDEIPVGRAKDLRGQRFGKLTVLYRTNPPEEKANKSAYWKCQCDCGNQIVVRTDGLTKKGTNQCGCESGLTRHSISIGDWYGDLQVVEKTDKRKENGGNIIYLCKCICGTLHEVSGNNLTCGSISSCGCKKASKGARKIEELLTANNVRFIKEKYIPQCTLPTGGHPFFDFYVQDSYFIEFDGEQHFKAVSLFGGEEMFSIQQAKDQCKNQWCKENSIPLIRIPYTKLDTLSIEDLLLETTAFRVV